LQQCFIFARLRPDDNLYAHPCDFVPVLGELFFGLQGLRAKVADSHTGEVLSIDYPPTNPAPGESYPASSAKDYEAGPKRARIPPPMTPQNYLPEQIAKDDPTFKVRDTLKPLHVLQPEGVSYRMDGRTLRWQNWNIHVGFTYR
jgi:primary-amine oxidase